MRATSPSSGAPAAAVPRRELADAHQHPLSFVRSESDPDPEPGPGALSPTYSRHDTDAVPFPYRQWQYSDNTHNSNFENEDSVHSSHSYPALFRTDEDHSDVGVYSSLPHGPHEDNDNGDNSGDDDRDPPTDMLVEATPLMDQQSSSGPPPFQKHLSSFRNAISRTINSTATVNVFNRSAPTSPSVNSRSHSGSFGQSPTRNFQSRARFASPQNLINPFRDMIEEDAEEGRGELNMRNGHATSESRLLPNDDYDDDTFMDDRIRALRIWSRIDNLDSFLERVYTYFVEKGFYAIILARLSNLLLPGLQIFFLTAFGVWWFWQTVYLILDIPKLYEIKLVYTQLLEVSETDMDTVEWQEIIQKLTEVKLNFSESNPESRPDLETLDAHTIISRIMRRENYLIAMFNKEVLNLKFPGIFRNTFSEGMLLTKIMEGIANEFFEIKLQKRFELMAILNVIFSPFMLVIMILYFLFKYAEEYQKSPNALSARQYTLHARYKMREFNELQHIFETRLNRALPKSTQYLAQFRYQKTILIARLVSFVSGAFVAALAALAIVDHELTEFEITPGKSALFYMTVFGGLLAASRGMVPEEGRVFEPEKMLREVAEDTHYLPDEWRGRLHTEEVKAKFAALFSPKITQLILEIISVPLAPVILYFSLPQSSEAIIDFLREYTVEMDSVGHVCSFAAFDFARHGDPRYGVPATILSGGIGSDSPTGGHHISRQGKMEQSFLFFKANYPQWDTPLDGSMYLQALGRTQRTGALNAEASVLFDEPDGGAVARNGAAGSSSTIKRNVQFRGASRFDSAAFSDADADARRVGIFGILDAAYEANAHMRL
ncbi:autophagy protein atg9 [Entophlyctis sp. JEL0112]|nr:autophagy protein atg9 [Entophlyctis sp. JEL0112]